MKTLRVQHHTYGYGRELQTNLMMRDRQNGSRRGEKEQKAIRAKELSTKIVEQDILRLHSQAVQHLHARLEHERRTTEVVLDVLGRGMILQIVVINDLVDEPRVPGPVVLG